MAASHLTNRSNTADALLPSEAVKTATEYRALHDFAHGKIHDVSQAQEKFCEAVEDRYMSTQDSAAVEDILYQDWQAVTGMAAQTSHHAQQQKLVDVILAVQSRPTLQKGNTVCQIEGQTVWSDLPMFGAQMRECWNFVPTKDGPQEAKSHWRNLNVFAALLTQTAFSRKISKVDFSLYAIWSIRTALEENEEVDELSVEVACEWLKLAAHAIYAMCQENKAFDGKVAKAGKLFEDKTWTGFSVERWREWSSRLSAMQDQHVSEHCEKLIAEARQAMGEQLER